MKSLKDLMHDWWYGEKTIISDDPDVIRVFQGKPHWTARCVKWMTKEFKWIIGILIAAYAAYHQGASISAKDLEVAQNRIAVLEAMIEGRTISEEQKLWFIKSVKNCSKPKVDVVWFLNSGEEPRRYANNIADLLQMAGFKSVVDSVPWGNAEFDGLRLLLNKEELKEDENIKCLVSAFADIGMHFSEIEVVPKLTSGIRIDVGDTPDKRLNNP